MTKSRIGVVSCGVLASDLRHSLAKLDCGSELVSEILPAQLHNNPQRLRQLLQAQIDSWSADPQFTAIVIIYGMCGRGTVGLLARRIPLVLPRTQDCIGILLGSHQRYQQEFQRHPGSRYMSQGWYETTVQGRAATSYLSARDHSLYGDDLQTLTERYGADNAEYICRFRESWKRNYSRSAYISFADDPVPAPGLELSEATAATLGWEHHRLDGDRSLLQALLTANWDDERILVVPPYARVTAAPGNAVLGHVTGTGEAAQQLLQRFTADNSASSSGAAKTRRRGLGLGIDTGGTYTDAVIYDFTAGKVIASSKAATRHDNLILGIRQALALLPASALRKVERVGISTTLATNAFVENKGRPVGLFLLSPLPTDPQSLPFRFVERLRGIINMEGEQLEPIDPDQVVALAQQAVAAGCEAIAISGFASIIEPQHELEVARLVAASTGLYTVCGHQLSSELNFLERATTAAMNARLVPLIEHLLDAIRQALAEHDLGAVQVMVVRGDGSQMLDRVAAQVPVQTILSGPAASVVGAAHLFAETNAVVADMGGTTLDVAVVRNGLPLADCGARIGGFQTCVRAMRIETIGLGGDSEIDLSLWPQVKIGPRRLIPICRLHEQYPQQSSALLERIQSHTFSLDVNCLDVVACRNSKAPASPMLRELSRGPQLLSDLAQALGRPAPRFIAWQALESNGQLQRFGLTLTDILHVENRFRAFDRPAAQVLLNAWAKLLEVDSSDIIAAIYAEFRCRVAAIVMGMVLPEDCPWDETQPLARWLSKHLSADTGAGSMEPHLRLNLGMPLIPVGAPTPELFPQLQSTFNTRLLISEHAGVANAIGAIAGEVMLREQASLRFITDGSLLCSWRGGSCRPASLENGIDQCLQAITALLRQAASDNQITWQEPAITAAMQQAESRDGPVFFGLNISAELRG